MIGVASIGIFEKVGRLITDKAEAVGRLGWSRNEGRCKSIRNSCMKPRNQW